MHKAAGWLNIDFIGSIITRLQDKSLPYPIPEVNLLFCCQLHKQDTCIQHIIMQGPREFIIRGKKLPRKKHMYAVE